MLSIFQCLKENVDLRFSARVPQHPNTPPRAEGLVSACESRLMAVTELYLEAQDWK